MLVELRYFKEDESFQVVSSGDGRVLFHCHQFSDGWHAFDENFRSCAHEKTLTETLNHLQVAFGLHLPVHSGDIHR